MMCMLFAVHQPESQMICSLQSFGLIYFTLICLLAAVPCLLPCRICVGRQVGNEFVSVIPAPTAAQYLTIMNWHLYRLCHVHTGIQLLMGRTVGMSTYSAVCRVQRQRKPWGSIMGLRCFGIHGAYRHQLPSHIFQNPRFFTHFNLFMTVTDP